ncbi:MAG: class I SAM-dependent methyltransferase [Nitrospirae bacterium]|nr:class I SAM-dependent methyltransferase [Nitrospirota bacterium]
MNKMDELSKEYVISFFGKKLGMHGDKAETVGWTAAGQRRRFECMLDIGRDLEGKRVLDYGCGKGDFYQFLRDRNISVQYTGMDINAGLISLARQKHPEGGFHVFDIESDQLSEDFDYIFLCGVFNLRVGGLTETVHNVLIKLFHHCRGGMAFNALSAHDPKQDYELHYLYPGEMFEFAVKNLSPFVSLRNDRLPYDFTMFVYKG